MFFGGGGNTDVVDIYDTTTGLWTTDHLSHPRYSTNAVSCDGKIFWGGGWSSGALDVVDIYDASSGQWSVVNMPHLHSYPGAASAGGMVFFGGAYDDKSAVDIYDISTDSWSTASLSQARYGLTAAAAGNKVLFGGGCSGSYGSKQYYDVVDIYDTSTGTWSTATLSEARQHPSATSVGNKVLFAGGSIDGGYSNRVDIYTLQTYDTITSSKDFDLVDQTTVTGRMQLNVGASLDLGDYNLTVGSMEGVAPINLSIHKLTIGSDNTDSAYAGSLSGDGNLIKIGDGILTLSGSNSYLGNTTIGAGELRLLGPNAWNPLINLGGAHLLGGEIVFDYSGSADPYSTILGLLNTKITGSAPLNVVNYTLNARVTVSLAVPEPSTLVLLLTASIGSLLWWHRRR